MMPKLRSLSLLGLSAVLIVSLLWLATSAGPADNNQFQFKKQPELEQIRTKKPVKIKLKRTAKDDYSWELSGDDVDEIVKTDKKLRKQLGVQ